MGKHPKTLRMLEAVRDILAVTNPMTVRQVYYQLVSRQVVKNNRSQYQAVSNILVDARKDGTVPWDWIEDRTRRPRAAPMWWDRAAFAAGIAQGYRRNVWRSQPAYLEVWLEKDALSGIAEDVLAPYGVTLNVGRGYDGWASIHDAAERYRHREGVCVLYLGDFDPSGVDMVRSLRDRLADLECRPEIVTLALTRQDITDYRLPPDFTKTTDSRRAAFVERFGDVSVELDALPIAVLRDRLIAAVEDRMDLKALTRLRQAEEAERARLVESLAMWQAAS